MASVGQSTSDYLTNASNAYLANDPLNFLMSDGTGMQMHSASEMGRKVSRNETIHSGHFMLSEIDDAEAQEAASQEAPLETSFEQLTPLPLVEEAVKNFEVSTTVQETTQKYTYGPRSQTVMIDASLSKLFECMSLAYHGTLTSPKWKSFKGLRLKLKDKIRLNNIIWRAWHIQCSFSRPVCLVNAC